MSVNLIKIGALVKIISGSNVETLPAASLKRIKENDGGTGIIGLYFNDSTFISLNAATDLQVDGAAAADLSDFYAKIATVFPDADSSTGMSAWIGQVHQGNPTNPPYDNVFKNLLGGFINWSRVIDGVYNGYLENAFPNWRTVFRYSPQKNGKLISVDWIDSGNIQITQTDLQGAAADGLIRFDLQIIIYPSSQLND